MTAVCFALPDGSSDRITSTVDSGERAATVVRPFPVVGANRPVQTREIATDAPPGQPPRVNHARDGEPPDWNAPVFRSRPPLRLLVLIITSYVLAAVPARTFPDAAVWIDFARDFLSVGGQYWLLLSPFTPRTPLLLVVMAMPMLMGHRAPGPAHRVLSALDYVLLFLTMQAFVISLFRTMRRKGRGFMALWELDQEEEGQDKPPRVGNMNI
jgi:hypothetical protein